MIYLIRRDSAGAIVARLPVERVCRAAELQARGWERVDSETFWAFCDARPVEVAPPAPASKPSADPPPLPSFVPSEALEAAGQNYTFATPWGGR